MAVTPEFEIHSDRSILTIIKPNMSLSKDHLKVIEMHAFEWNLTKRYIPSWIGAECEYDSKCYSAM